MGRPGPGLEGSLDHYLYALDSRSGTLGTMRAGNPGKASPTGVMNRRDSTNNPGLGSWGGPFPQGALMGMGDGTVRMFPYQMQTLGAFLTPNGGEAVVLPDT